MSYKKPPIFYGKNHPNYNPDLHIIITSKCKCGCGEDIIYPKSKPKRFVYGHQFKLRRGRKNFNYNPDLHIPQKTQCCCGCGGYVKHSKARPKKFIRGHNTRMRTKDEKRNQIKKALEALKAKNDANGRVTPLYELIKESSQYKNWRKKVFKRDNYTCQDCFERGIELQAHHKKAFSIILAEFLKEYDQFSPIEDKETLVRLATKYQPFWDITNGKTLCLKCHKKIQHFNYKTVAQLI